MVHRTFFVCNRPSTSIYPQLKWSMTVRMPNLTQVVIQSTNVTKEFSTLLEHIRTNNTILPDHIRLI